MLTSIILRCVEFLLDVINYVDFETLPQGRKKREKEFAKPLYETSSTVTAVLDDFMTNGACEVPKSIKRRCILEVNASIGVRNNRIGYATKLYLHL